LEIILLILFFLIGISVGSFLNVVADRVPLRQSIISPPSHCFNCGHVLAGTDLVPVISYIALGGKCRYCGASIGPRSMVIEIITGLFFVLAWLRFGADLQLLASIIFTAVFIVLIITDLENRKMPAVFIYAAIIFALLLAAVRSITGAGPDLAGSMAGFAVGFAVPALAWVIFKWAKKDFMGFWIAWVAGLIGASIGYPAIIPALAVALLACAAWAGIEMLTKKEGKHRVPVAAVLCCAALIIIYTGQFYLGKIGI
jgi:prepilin signal peptidase PulO-like enzyme (type II secretory pathway)